MVAIINFDLIQMLLPTNYTKRDTIRALCNAQYLLQSANKFLLN